MNICEQYKFNVLKHKAIRDLFCYPPPPTVEAQKLSTSHAEANLSLIG